MVTQVIVIAPIVLYISYRLRRARRFAAVRSRDYRFANETRRSRWSNRGGF